MIRRMVAAVRSLDTQLTRERALAVAEGTSALSHLVSALEYLVQEQDRRPGGINDWALTRQNYGSWSRCRLAGMDALAHRQVTRAVHIGQVSAAITLLLPTGRRIRAVAATFLALTDLALYPRRYYGTDGSDQAAFLVQASAAVARLADRPRTTDAVLWYIALQSTLSYTVSGWAKVAGSPWRGGEALPGVLRTLTYGDERVWRLAQRYPRSARALGIATVAMEGLFPLVYARRGAPSAVFVGAAAAFHLAVARVMGLNRFLTAFGAMHPAVLYTAGPRLRPGPGGAVEKRDDLVPALTASGGALVGTALAVLHLRRGAVVRAGRSDERIFRTSKGSTLAYRLTSQSRSHRPMVVFENGLGATAQHWERIRDAVSRHADVLTYDRAGYGRSVRAPGQEYSLDDSVNDIAELIRDEAPGQPVVLVGHSLGGFLAWRTAHRLRQVTGLVLIDPSHPAELERSVVQRAGAEALDRQLTAMERNLRVGLGALVVVPSWVRHIPERQRPLTIAQLRHASTWATARREWAAAKCAFHDDDRALAPLDIPVLVLTAARTLEVDPIVRELHDDMVACAGPGSSRRTVVRTAHDTILVRPGAAEHVASVVAAFVEGLQLPGVTGPLPNGTGGTDGQAER